MAGMLCDRELQLLRLIETLVVERDDLRRRLAETLNNSGAKEARPDLHPSHEKIEASTEDQPRAMLHI